MNLPYKEGLAFLVPLRNGGYGRGVLARASPQGKGLLGYFFGPQLPSIKAANLKGLKPSNAILRVRFGDLGLINGKWRAIGTVANWNRSEWPMPNFVRKDPLGKRKPILVVYADDDPLRIKAEYPIDDDFGIEDDSAYGYGAVEIALTKLLKTEP